ncbi:MAG: glutamine--fructose-6-phosphate transaminase (isomerizing) [Raoultibacter sp.]
MCGIVGYTGSKQVTQILINGLKRLEYRGYDSAGVSVQDGERLRLIHGLGKVALLEDCVKQAELQGRSGIGHTRWATHGKPSIANAHPHSSCDGHVALVHNGIIENYLELREELIERGHNFTSDTDTEVLAHLIEENYEGDLLAAVRTAVSRVIGAYGLAVMTDYEPGTIVVTRKDSPIVLGVGKDGSYLASDIIALIEATRDVVILGDYEFAKMSPAGIEYFMQDGRNFTPEVTHVNWDVDLAEKGGYPDFMLKEIHEQPRVVRDTMAGRMINGELTIDELDLSYEELNLIDRVYVIACGTSYHAGLIAKQLIERWARIPTEVEVASEFRYRNPIITSTTLVVAVSQSGETADTLAAIRDARIKGAKVFSITNVIGSPVARESDGVIYTKANKEIAVASTKSFLGQVVSLTMLAMLLAQTKSMLSTKEIHLLFSEMANTAEQIEEILADDTAIKQAALACVDAASALYIGRGFGCATCYEGALKLKEISYLHAEAYAAGEMKHGPIALLDSGFPVIAIATQSPTYDKVISNLQECRAREALIIAIATVGDEEIKKHADHVIYIPKVRDVFSPIVASVPLQLFARHIAVARGCDVDQPRNLAKSVTVE